MMKLIARGGVITVRNVDSGARPNNPAAAARGTLETALIKLRWQAPS